MRSSQQVQTRVTLPDPGQARTLDELIERLRSLKIWAPAVDRAEGSLSRPRIRRADLRPS